MTRLNRHQPRIRKELNPRATDLVCISQRQSYAVLFITTEQQLSVHGWILVKSAKYLDDEGGQISRKNGESHSLDLDQILLKDYKYIGGQFQSNVRSP